MFSLDGRIALITGGSRGLGLEMARTLGKAGARVIITARKSPELELARENLAADGIQAVSIVNDLADRAGVPTLVDEIEARCGSLDILVNNAGTTWGGSAAELEWSAWQKVIDVNLNGTWCLTQEVARRMMLPRRQGSIIMVASIGGLRAVPPNGVPTVAYNTSKAALLNLSRSLAAEWGGAGVRVNALAPGWFETRMTTETVKRTSAHVLPRVPAGRYGDPATDICGPILFLASDASRYVTGHTLVVDGGMSAVL